MSVADKTKFTQLLAPFAPFMADELYEVLLGENAAKSDAKNYSGIHVQSWPEFDPQKAVLDEIVIPVQIAGKVRAELLISQDQANDQEFVLQKALELPDLEKYIAGKKKKKKIYVPGKIVSLVVS